MPRSGSARRGRDLVEGDGEHVVQHEGEPLGGRQCFEYHEQRETDRVGQERFLLGVVSVLTAHDRLGHAERAALALTEAVTRLSDRPDPVPDAIWDEAARHFDEPALAALLVAIATVNVWNRLNVAARQVAFGALPQHAG